MTTTQAHDAGVRRALANVRRKADDLIAAVIDAETAMNDDRPLPAGENPRGGGDRGGSATTPARLPLADEALQPERLVTADSMEPGGWVRLPGEQRWRQLHSVTSCRSGDPCRMLAFRDGHDPVHLEKATTLPYLSAAEMADGETCGAMVAEGKCALGYGHTGRCQGAREAAGEVA